MRTKPTPTEKRVNRLEKRVEQEVYIFPKKRDDTLNRLVRKATHKRPKTLKQQMDDWKEFQEKTG